MAFVNIMPVIAEGKDVRIAVNKGGMTQYYAKRKERCAQRRAAIR